MIDICLCVQYFGSEWDPCKLISHKNFYAYSMNRMYMYTFVKTMILNSTEHTASKTFLNLLRIGRGMRKNNNALEHNNSNVHELFLVNMYMLCLEKKYRADHKCHIT